MRDGLLLIYRWVLYAIGFKMMGEAPDQSNLGFCFWYFYWIGEAIHEVGWCNRPPCLIKRIFTKSVQEFIGILRMPDSVSIKLEDTNSREGRISESRI